MKGKVFIIGIGVLSLFLIMMFMMKDSETDISSISIREGRGEIALADTKINQSSGKIVFSEKGTELNASLRINLTGRLQRGNETVWARQYGNRIKFGWNRTFPPNFFTKHRNISSMYLIESRNPLSIRGKKVFTPNRIKQFRCGNMNCQTMEREIIDFNDICKVIFRKDVTRNQTKRGRPPVIFDPACNLTLIDNYTARIDFKSLYNNTIRKLSIDPNVVFVLVNQTASTLANITLEDNYTHLNVSEVVGIYGGDGDATDGIILYMPFDANNSAGDRTIHDWTPFQHDGTRAATAPTWTGAGKYGGAYSFGAGEESIVIDDTTTLRLGATDFAMLLWINTDSVAGFRGAITKFGGGLFNYYFGLSSDELFFSVDDGAETSVSTAAQNLVTNTWYHVGVVFNDSNNQIQWYVDGNNVENDTFIDIPTTTDDITLGISPFAGEDWEGEMDEIMFFDNMLTRDEVRDIYLNSSDRHFSGGTQTFDEVNVSSTGNENRINITINQSLEFNSTINVTVGDQSGAGYSYGDEFAFTNDEATEIPVTTPNNISIRMIFYAGNNSGTNDFYSPTLNAEFVVESYIVSVAENNVSFTWTFVNNSVISSSVVGTEGLDSNINSTGANDKLVNACINGTGFCQTVSLGYINFTNTGDVAVEFNISLNQSEPVGVDVFGSLTACNASPFDINSSINYTVNSSIPVNQSEICWICGNFTDASIAQTTGSVLLNVYSSD